MPKETINKYPLLETDRLVLRRFTLDDAPTVQRLAGDKKIADTTTNVPHPYEDGMAEEWINTHELRYKEGTLLNFAITLRNSGDLVGAIGLIIQPAHFLAELGYWIGKPYWGAGYCTEAARAVIEYAFQVLKLNKISASFMIRNPASGRVMEKLAMKSEGAFRQHIMKNVEWKLETYHVKRQQIPFSMFGYLLRRREICNLRQK